MHTLNALQQKINNAKSLDFGDIISNSFDLFKKVWLKGFLVVLFIILIAFILSLVFQVLGLSPGVFDINNGFELETLTEFYSENILYSIPQTILVSTATIGFLAAFYRICKREVQGETGNDDYFYFFNNGYFTRIFMLGIIYTGIATVAQLLLFIPYIYVFVPLSYFAVVFAFNPDLSETEIIKASFALGNKKWLITFGTMLVMGIIAMLGILACGVGLLFTMSIMYLPVFLIYKDIIGFKSHSEIEKIGQEDDSQY